MATLNYLTSDWLECALLCFGVPPVPKCSVDVCCVWRKSFVTVVSGCGPRRDANGLSRKGKIALEPRKIAQCTFKPLAPTTTTYDSVSSTQTHLSNQRAIKKNWENYTIEVFSALGRGYKNTHKMPDWMYVRTQQGNFPWDASDKRQKSCSSSVCSALFISGGSLSSWHLARVSRTQKLTARWQLEPRLPGRGTAHCRVIRATVLVRRFGADTRDEGCKRNSILEQKLFPSVTSRLFPLFCSFCSF